MPGVYLSFPFCAQKCSFCNFASGVFPRELERDYLTALRSEIRSHRWNWQPETVYIGGGTPSRISIEELRSLLGEIPGGPWRESTIEAAPGSFDAALVRAWRESGINRVSLGVQSFVTRELTQTGRRHTAATVESDCRTLREEGISDINIDLIAGLPWQTPETWRESLDAVERLRPTHVSVYMFEIDEDSRLGLEVLNTGGRYGANAVPDADLTASMYETAVERLRSMGIERYEISNFAIPGRESLHNLKYWVLEPYIGFGADAHSFDGRRRWGNTETAADYVARHHAGVAPALPSTDAVEAEERFFVGLRLMRGVEAAESDLERFGAGIARLTDAGLLSVEGRHLRLTDRGVLLSNEVFEEFIA